MEADVEQLDLETRRLYVATWIQGNLQPTARAIDSEINPAQTTQQLETREYQLDAWASLWDARQAGAKTGLIHLATGLGKTSVAVFDVMKYCEEYEGSRKGESKILFVSHQEEINNQAAERFAAFMPDMTQGSFMGRKKEKDRAITFATLQSLHRNLESFKPEDFDYIVYDEAHHLKAKTFEEVTRYFKPHFQLALTATPDRMDELNIRELFGNELYSKSLAEALAEGLLVDVDYHIVFDDAVKAAITSGFEPQTLRELRELMDVTPRNEVIARNIKDEMHKIGLDNAKTIVFCEDIEHAEAIAELLGGEAYHSGVKKVQRSGILGRFRGDGLQIITTRDMFNEGVDIPDARIVVFLRSTGSKTVFEQQLGRGLRRSPGKERVTVLDFAANIERITVVRDLSENIRQVRNRNMSDGEAENGETTFHRETVSSGLHIDHVDFDFDKLSIDLLNKFESLRRPDAPLASEREYSIHGAAEAFGASARMLGQLIDELSWDLPLRKFGPQTVRSLTTEQVEELRRIRPEAFMIPLDGDFYSIKSAASELGVDHGTVKKIIKSLGWDLPLRKFGGGVVTGAITPAQLDALREHPNISVQDGDHAISIPHLSKELGVSQRPLQDLAKSLGMVLGTYKFGKSGRGKGFTEEQAEIIRSKIPQPIADNEVIPKIAAEQLGIHSQSLMKIVAELGMVLAKRKPNGRKPTPVLSANQMQAIRDSEYYREIVTNDKVALRRRAQQRKAHK